MAHIYPDDVSKAITLQLESGTYGILHKSRGIALARYDICGLILTGSQDLVCLGIMSLVKAHLAIFYYLAKILLLGFRDIAGKDCSFICVRIAAGRTA